MQAGPDFFQRTRDYHILVLGDVMLDRYIHGTVERVSPEAPVPVLHWRTTENRLGGAANVALNIKRLGSRVSIGGVTGNDKSAITLREMLDKEGITRHLLATSETIPTIVKTRVLGGHQHLLRIDEEEPYEVEDHVFTGFMSGLLDLWERDRFDAIVLQDYNKGFLSGNLIHAVMEFAHQRSIPVAVDPKDENFFSFTGATIFKPNLRELKAQVPFPVNISDDSLIRATEYLRERLHCLVAAITLSEHGIFISTDSESARYPTKAQTVVDVCGAGDAVISVLTLGFLMGLPLSVMADLANTAGGVVCEHVGVCPVDVEQMSAIIARPDNVSTGSI